MHVEKCFAFATAVWVIWKYVVIYVCNKMNVCIKKYRFVATVCNFFFVAYIKCANYYCYRDSCVGHLNSFSRCVREKK